MGNMLSNLLLYFFRCIEALEKNVSSYTLIMAFFLSVSQKKLVENIVFPQTIFFDWIVYGSTFCEAEEHKSLVTLLM